MLLSVYNPGFHIGLRPHSTLGYSGVSCLKALVISLNADNNTASTAQCNGIEFRCACPVFSLCQNLYSELVAIL